MCTTAWDMAPASSPYALFQASDWSSAVASPIGIGQCIRLQRKKFYPKSDTQKKRVGTISKKVRSSSHVQLAFAWHVFTSVIPVTSIATLYLLAVLTIALFRKEHIWLANVLYGIETMRINLPSVPKLLNKWLKINWHNKSLWRCISLLMHA